MRARGLSWTAPANDFQDRLAARGLFGQTTPSATAAFLARYGYGVVEQVAVIKASYAEFNAEGATRTESSTASPAYAQAETSCQKQAAIGTGRIDLDAGGALGVAYGNALDLMYHSSAYQEAMASVLACMSGKGVELAHLDDAPLSLIKKLVEMVGGTYSRQADGSLRYEVGSVQGKPFRAADLDELRDEEMHRADIERRCRDDQAATVDRLWATYSAPVLTRFAAQISVLKRALITNGESR
jgi:hypothetical protein